MAKQKTKKGIKKSFHEVVAPLTSTNIFLYAAEKEDLLGKKIKIDMTKNLKGKSLDINFRISLDKDQLVGIPEKINLSNAYIRRIMRKGVDYVEDSFETECRDFIIRIKPFLITRKRVSRAVLKALRNNTKQNISSYIKTRTSKEIFSDIITNKLQKQLSQKLKKIYPLALCEIRMFEVIGKKNEKR